MMSTARFLLSGSLAAVLVVVGCNKPTVEDEEFVRGSSHDATLRGPTGDRPALRLAVGQDWPSRVFQIAADRGMVDPQEGQGGPVELSWNVDLVYVELDGAAALQAFRDGKVDAIILPLDQAIEASHDRPSDAIFVAAGAANAPAGEQQVFVLARSVYEQHQVDAQYMASGAIKAYFDTLLRMPDAERSAATGQAQLVTTTKESHQRLTSGEIARRLEDTREAGPMSSVPGLGVFGIDPEMIRIFAESSL